MFFDPQQHRLYGVYIREYVVIYKILERLNANALRVSLQINDRGRLVIRLP